MSFSATKEKLQEAAQRKQSEVKAALNRLEGALSEGGELLTEERLAILALSPDVLLQQLKAGQLMPSAVLRAFQAKAIVVTYRINCVTEFIPQAETWASALEVKGPNSGSLPLYGLPVSIKDNFQVQGLDTSHGLAKYLYQSAPCHSTLVQSLLALGAIPFCKTNIPQTLLSYRCSNPVWGETVNPFNPQRTCGGSSGGEAALIGAGGSMLGLGSDTGGSIRIPAHFCGVVGIKPTSGRLSSKGLRKGVRGIVGIESAPGFLGSDVSIVVTALRSVLEGGPMMELDPELPPLSWRHHIFNDIRPLTIGWYEDDNLFPVTPGCRRAVYEARQALAAAGHNMVPFTPPAVDHAWKLITSCFSADQGRNVISMWENEETESTMEDNLRLLAAPRFVKAVKKHMIHRKSPLLAELLSSGTARSHQLWRALGDRQDYINDVLNSWKSQHLDIVLCPAFSMPAPPPSYPAKIMAAFITTCLYNLLDFPAGVVPVTRENEEDQVKLQHYPTNDLMFQLVKEATTGAVGMPIGVQIVGLPWQEEMVCRGMMEVERALKDANAEKEAK
ncbi:fatty acid amide hydrolase 1-like [Macrobrachium rosenbergii]|uniref:fatty acid amide hydrolase 1-like n=1 Tax=Macrobrachium rosenbergii TaxID=79674 RepID=UPI0034D65E0E